MVFRSSSLSVLFAAVLTLGGFLQVYLAHAQVQAQRTAVDRLAQTAPGSPHRTSVFADGDENWDDRFGFPGVSGTVYAVASAPNGDIYVGGYLSSAGGAPVSNVARWDGRRWHALDEGVNGYVQAIAIAPNGEVYIGGDFVNAGTLRVNGLARWNPATKAWSQVGSGVTDEYGAGEINALAFQGNNLYLAGSFVKAGGQSVYNLAMWDGTSFQALGTGIGRFSWDGTFEGGSGGVSALAVDGDLVYVGGFFEAVDAGQANSIAAWNSATSSWSTLNGGADAGYTYAYPGTVHALAARDGILYVGGDFGYVGPFGAGTPAAEIARWDGTAWSALGTGLEGAYGASVNTVAILGDVIHVGGDFNTAGGRQARYVAGWQNGEWFEPAGGFGGRATRMAAGPDGALYVGGDWVNTAGDNIYVGSIGKLHNGAWKGLGEGVGSNSIAARIQTLAADGTRLYAGGYPTHAGSNPVSGIAAWNGAAWEAMGVGTGDTYGSGTVMASAVAPNGEIYVGGTFTMAGGQSANHIAVWNPATRTWRALGSGTNDDVYAIAVDGGDVYVGGAFTAAGGVLANRIARWDGTQWHAVGTGVNYPVKAVAVADNGDLYIGGDFNKAGGFDANAIAVWNGANWSALGRGLMNAGGTYGESVYSIALVGTDLYVVGDFVTAGTSSAAGVAKWTQGTGWSALGTGLGGNWQTGRALLRDGNRLYVGGDFKTAGGLTSNNIAIWNLASSTWEVLGSGVEGEVQALALLGGDLYVGGDIKAAGGKASTGIARWSDGTVQAVARFGVDTQALNFGDVTLGQAVQRTVTITNDATATATLQITVAALAAPFSIVRGGGTATLAPGAGHQVLVGFSPAAAGTYNETISITHNGANAVSPASVALTGKGVSRGGDVVVLRNFDPAGAQQLIYAERAVPIDTGFVFGTNIYGDRSKSVTLDLPAGKAFGRTISVSQIDVYFSFVKAGVSNQTYTLHLYATDEANKPAGSPVFSQTYNLADASGDDNPATVEAATSHTFSQAVSMTPPFAVAVDFGAYGSDAILAAVAVNNPVNQRIENVWEQWSDGTWHNVSDAWTGTYNNGVPVPGSGSAGWQPWIEALAVTPTSADATDDLPREYLLGQNYPNPFNPSTTIEFALPAAGPVLLQVFDLTGREVATLIDTPMPAGTHSVHFEASALASGLYVYRLSAGLHQVSRLLTVLK